MSFNLLQSDMFKDGVRTQEA